MFAMRYIATRLSDSLKYVIKTDDDVMLDTLRWMSVVNPHFSHIKLSLSWDTGGRDLE